MTQLLDNIPLTSILTVIVALVGGVIAFFHPGDIDVFLKYSAAVGAGSGGLGVLGIARSAAGKG